MPVQFTATDKITILGTSGSGKTTMGRRLHESGIWPRVVVFDLNDDYEPKGFDFVSRSFSEFCSDIQKAADRDSFRLLYRFDAEADPEDPEFNEALRILFYVKNVFVVVEEVWMVASKHKMPRWMKKIILSGRRHGIGMLATSQRTAETHNTLISQCGHLFLGLHDLEEDIKFLSFYVGKDLAGKLLSLKQGDFIQRSKMKEGGIDLKIVNNRN